MDTKKFSLLPVFFTVFIDMVGVGIVIPIFANLVIRNDAGLLALDSSFASRALLLGLLTAVYPASQFFGAPLLGAMSDRYGRKLILVLSLLGTVAGYLLFGFGITIGSLWILFLSRAIDGFTGGNISIAMSSIADISDHSAKSRNFGLIGMAFGLGFIIGPAIGGLLSDSHISPLFTYATPFWVAAILSSINVLLVLWRFTETLDHRVESEMSLFTGFRNIRRAFALRNLRTMFLVVFLLTFGFNFFTQFFQVFLIQKFSFTESEIGGLFAFVGVWIVVGQGLLVRPLSRKFSPRAILAISALVLAIALPMLLLPSHAYVLFFILPFIAMSNGLTMPNYNAIISNLAGKKSQGEILGINQSIQALAMALPPLIAGLIVTIDRNFPIMMSGIVTLSAWLVFMLFFRVEDSHTYDQA